MRHRKSSKDKQDIKSETGVICTKIDKNRNSYQKLMFEVKPLDSIQTDFRYVISVVFLFVLFILVIFLLTTQYLYVSSICGFCFLWNAQIVHPSNRRGANKYPLVVWYVNFTFYHFSIIKLKFL